MTPTPDLAGRLLVNRVCDEFEREWRAGRRPGVAAFLDRGPPEHRADLLRELVQLDTEYRTKAGETPAAIDYTALGDVGGLFDTPPAALGEYDIGDRIAAGGMGVVYMARHRRMNRTVAVKILGGTAGGDPAELAGRFAREIEITALLSHPHVVTAFDAREDAGVRYLVTEYMPGGDLGRRVRDGGPVPVGVAATYARQAALGLGHAHAKGVVHRDVKPGNLLLDAGGAVRVADWGLARIGDSVRPGDGLTELGSLLGTVDYMAPEQARRPDKASPAADIYSLGCVLCFLLTGKPPFPGGSPFDRLAAHRATPPPDVRELRPDTPGPVAELVAAMLAKKPGDRPADMAAVAAALDRSETNDWAAIASTPPPAESLPISRRRFALYGIGGAATAVAGVAGWWYGIRPRRVDPPPPPPPPPDLAVRTFTADEATAYQHAWAERLGVPVERADVKGVRFVFVPPGVFRMGSPDAVRNLYADPRAEPHPERREWVNAEVERTVTIRKPFYLGRTEVTHAEFAAFADAFKYRTVAERFGNGWGYDAARKTWAKGPDFHWRNPGDYVAGPDHPIGNVGWNDAAAYCRWLSAACPPGETCRLPAESEWEYAARAGGLLRWGDTDDETKLAAVAVYGSHPTPVPVGGKRANGFGLFDVFGNLPEWCDPADPWAESMCPVERRPARGGNFRSPVHVIRAAAVQWFHPDAPDAGFRVLREIPR